MNDQLIPVLLAGGSGTRLWPISRETYPKQFCKLVGNYSLLQNTALRANDLAKGRDLIVVTNDAYYFLCKDQLDALGLTKVHYILEPCPKNTAPAISLAAHYAKTYINPNALLFVLPADHDFKEYQEFHAVFSQARPYLDKGHIAIFGIKPTAPKTGYGYIQMGMPLEENLFEVQRFVEKPTLKIAQEYLAQGDFYWNSGIFLFYAHHYLQTLNTHAPDIYQKTTESFSETEISSNFFRASASFSECRSGSIDYELMEKTDKAIVFTLNAAWNDLGCWSSVAESQKADEKNNVLQGNVIATNTENSFISSDGRQIVAIGIKDQVIISTNDALLIANKAYSQEVKTIVEKMKAEHQSVATKHPRVYRPWGYFESLLQAPTYQVKFLFLKPNAAISLQIHQHRCEHWTVVEGEADVINGQSAFCLKKNQSTYIDKNTKHRVSNPTDKPLIIIEVQSGDYLGEDDIIRFEDCYGRITEPTNDIPSSKG